MHAKFGMSPSQFARVLNRHRSKISRALSDEKGLISGKDQELIIQAAADHKVPLTSDDLTPEVQ
ncbi:hypothetical protein [Mesorhizobium waimense]|uniref:hypothetical protein n=1 Tax=Mesorhizobium waimense TaxID=1300307 RepID=UPI001FE01EEF|nr:hypothetical protein [Mesorhizobium waimense]